MANVRRNGIEREASTSRRRWADYSQRITAFVFGLSRPQLVTALNMQLRLPPELCCCLLYFFVADHAAPALVVPLIILPSTRPVYFVLPTENSI